MFASAVRMSVLTPVQVTALTTQVARDLGGTHGPANPLILTRQDWHGEEGNEAISVWPSPGTSASGSVVYLPSASPRPPPKYFWQNTQPLDAAMPAPWRDAVDRLTTLYHHTFIDGVAYVSPTINVLVSNDPDELSMISHGQSRPSTTTARWPAGLPPIRTDQASLSTGSQALIVTPAATAIARRAFTEYLQWPTTSQLYTAAGLPAGGFGWFGIWRPMIPSELNPSSIPVICPVPHSAHP